MAGHMANLQFWQPSHLVFPPADVSEQMGSHFSHLNLLTALRDSIPPMVAVDMLKSLLPTVTNTSMNLHSSIRRLTTQSIRPVITHRNSIAELILNLLEVHIVHFPRCLANQESQHFRLCCELNQRKLYSLIS